MKIITLSILLLLAANVHAAFTEFYCQGSGSNLNAGSTTNDAAVLTFAGGTWVSGTGVYTLASGNTAGVNINDWASVYTTSGATVAQYVGKITATNQTTITLSLTAFHGTASTPSATANATTLKIGGAWQGPSGTVGFPFGFAAYTATNGATVPVRVNFRNNAQYNITSGMAHSIAGPITFEGMTAVPGDLGKATFDGGNPSASFVLLAASGNDNDFIDLIFANNGTTSGSAQGVTPTGNGQHWLRCVSHDTYRSPWNSSTGSGIVMVECEAYNGNKANQIGHAGFLMQGNCAIAIRCVSHDNTTANTCGFVDQDRGMQIGCIAYNNGADGFNGSSGYGLTLIGCNAFNNQGGGFNLASGALSAGYFESCIAVSNKLGGIISAAPLRNGQIMNTWFGAGTYANAGGDIVANSSTMYQSDNGSFTANTTPWVAPATQNFTLTSNSQAKSVGRGGFTQLTAGTVTVSVPDTGAAQLADTNTTSGASGGSYTFAQ